MTIPYLLFLRGNSLMVKKSLIEKIDVELNITQDIIFKVVFGRKNETSKKLLLSLLNAILARDDEQKIVEIFLYKDWKLGELYDQRISVLNVAAQTRQGECILIELQMESGGASGQNDFYYWGLLNGQPEEVRPILSKKIVINILKRSYQTQGGYSSEGSPDLEKHKIFYLVDNLEMHLIQLPLFELIEPKEEMDIFEIWMLFLKASLEENHSLLEQIGEVEIIRTAIETTQAILKDNELLSLVYRIQQSRIAQQIYSYTKPSAHEIIGQKKNRANITNKASAPKEYELTQVQMNA